MPAPLIHIALAVVALHGPLAEIDKKNFILGTCFPDIRYLNVIDRTQTHVKNVSWDQIIQEKNHFKLGCLFHSFVDQLFDDFITKHNVYEKLPKSQVITQSFKLFADKILYKQHKRKLPGIINYFDDVISEELAFKIEHKNIVKWHEFLKKYFTTQYKCDFCSLAKEYSIIPTEVIAAINSIIRQMQKSSANKIVLKFYHFASDHIKKQKKYLEFNSINSSDTT